MSTLRDSLGNNLEVNDMVTTGLSSTQVIGKVLEIRPGGIISGLRKGGQEARPGMLVILARFELPFDPGMQIVGNCIKIYDPSPAPADEKTVESTPKLVTM